MTALTEKMNEETKLLRYILIILDKNIIEITGHFEYGARDELFKCIDWIQKNVSDMISTRKADIHKRRPGALFSSCELCFIWVSVVSRPSFTLKKEIFSLVRKCNSAMQDAVSQNTQCHFLPLTDVNEKFHFDQAGDLTLPGRSLYWRDLNETLKKFDRAEIDLPQSKTYERRKSPTNKDIDTMSTSSATPGNYHCRNFYNNLSSQSSHHSYDRSTVHDYPLHRNSEGYHRNNQFRHNDKYHFYRK